MKQLKIPKEIFNKKTRKKSEAEKEIDWYIKNLCKEGPNVNLISGNSLDADIALSEYKKLNFYNKLIEESEL